MPVINTAAAILFGSCVLNEAENQGREHVTFNTPECIFGKLHFHRGKFSRAYLLVGDHCCAFLFFLWVANLAA